MDKSTSNMARQVAVAAGAFQQQLTGHAPASVTVVLSEDILVITLQGALSQAERVLVKNPAGAAQVRELHRELFNNSSESLRREIKRITGVEVREATAEVQGARGAMVQVLATGTVVQVFLMAHGLPADAWERNGGGSQREKSGS